MRSKRFAVWSLILLLCIPAFSQTYGFKGLISGWITGNTESSIKPTSGIRFIPEFSLDKSLGTKYTLDAEFSLNAYGTGTFHAGDDIRTKGDVKPYRLWVRFSSSQFEARLGLQKINFGSATLLRPLMWFDRIDPRDPLQLTDGVYGLLLRYYFVNNANIWAWGLYGNDDPRGWEILTPDDDALEFGGRLQSPLGNGEVAFTYHHRDIVLPRLLTEQVFPNEPLAIPENRYALDGKWDIGIGVWFEGVLIHQHSRSLQFSWQRMLNLGLDYTFPWGNGVNVIGEHFAYVSADKALGSGQSFQFSALALNYPISLLDSIQGIIYYDWENKDLYNFVNWQRTYDLWSFHVMGFWNPERFQIYQTQTGNNLFAGRGFQIMAVLNF